ncbi:MAG: aspartate carbamoyltransferase regulatory subunit [Planctomycetota bacterium]
MPHRVRQVEAIEAGTVIDHIPSDMTLEVAHLLVEPEDQYFIGANLRSGQMGHKGVVKIAGKELSDATISRLALVAPGATMSIIRDYKVCSKHRVPIPERFTGIASCPNPNCITNHEVISTEFDVVDQQVLTLRCRHCERRFPADEVEII